MIDPQTRRALAETVVRLAEHLKRKTRAVIIDPAVAEIQAFLAYRLKMQALGFSLSAAGGIYLPKSQTLITASSTLRTIYQHGADFAAAMLPAVAIAEARKKKKKRHFIPIGLPGYQDSTLQASLDLMDQTTVEGIKEDWANLETDRKTLPEVTSAIAARLSAEIPARSKAAAEYQVSQAYHQGMRDVADDAARQGIQELQKRWDDQPDACPTCSANAAEGWLPYDILFSSGSSEPPEHPHCRCSIEYRGS